MFFIWNFWISSILSTSSKLFLSVSEVIFLLIGLILAGGSFQKGLFLDWVDRPMIFVTFCLLVYALGDDFVFYKVSAWAIACAFEMDSCNLTISVSQLSAVHKLFSSSWKFDLSTLVLAAPSVRWVHYICLFCCCCQMDSASERKFHIGVKYFTYFREKYISPMLDQDLFLSFIDVVNFAKAGWFSWQLAHLILWVHTSTIGLGCFWRHFTHIFYPLQLYLGFPYFWHLEYPKGLECIVLPSQS